MLQCVVAFLVAWQSKDLPRRPLRLTSFVFLAVTYLIVFALGFRSESQAFSDARQAQTGSTKLLTQSSRSAAGNAAQRRGGRVVLRPGGARRPNTITVFGDAISVWPGSKSTLMWHRGVMTARLTVSIT